MDLLATMPGSAIITASQQGICCVFAIYFVPHAPPSLLNGREYSLEKKVGLLLLQLASSTSMKDIGLSQERARQGG